ncbi:MAG: PAS domain-containing protein [Gallionellaceae bacterium]|jgi:PAS domain S-box-containing protein
MIKAIKKIASSSFISSIVIWLLAAKRREMRAQRDLALQNLKLREKALEQISEGVLISGPNRLITYVNSGFEKITGYTPQEVLGKSCALLQGTETSPETIAKMSAALQAGLPFHGEVLNYRKDGSAFWNELSMAPVFDEAGKLIQFVAVQRDITERVKTREALYVKEFALNAAANAMLITDVQGRIEWANKAYRQMTGFEFEEISGKNSGELTRSGLHSKEFYAQLWRTILNKDAWVGELLNRRKDHSLYHEEMSIAPLLDERGEITHFVAVKQDISARKAMERDLRDAKANMKRLLDAMSECAYAIDLKGKCTFVNQSFLDFLGYSDEKELVGLEIHNLIHHTRADGSHYPESECVLQLVVQTHQPFHSDKEVFWHKNGSPVQVECWAHPIFMDGVVVGVITTFVDISARVTLEQERNKMSGQLLQKNRLLQEYSERVKEEEITAREFIRQFTALDKISDPLVQFMLKPATNFSGDMIAFARTPDNRLHVLLADSAGHGLTAALAVIPITQPFYKMTAKGFDIAAIAKDMNMHVRNYLPLPRYVACVLLSMDAESRTIQVWNGGMPPVLLLGGDGREIKHRFSSKHLPMGVVNVNNFNTAVEHFNYDGLDASQLLFCSDGATEMVAISNGYPTGYDALLSKANQLQRENLLDRLSDTLMIELGEQDQEDDIAIVVVQCPTESNIDANQAALPDAIQLPHVISDIDFSKPGRPVWEYRLTLTEQQLKRLDVVPLLVNIASQIDGDQSSSKIYLVLAELFNNALDHGVLKLNSSLKHKGADMEEYFDERARRMNELESGQIEMHLEKYRCAAGYFMKIYFKDSGDGFDFSAIINNPEPENQRVRHGRGIRLLSGTCNALQYSGNGSEVIAYLELPGAG